MSSEIFISYSKRDVEQAAHLAARLLEAGYTVWWDDRIPPHKSYRDNIEENLTSASAVVVLWSKTSTKSKWVISEAEHGLHRSVLIQVAIDPIPLPRPFDQYQFVSMSRASIAGGGNVAGWNKVITSLEELVGKAGSPRNSKAKRIRSFVRGRFFLKWASSLLLVFCVVLSGVVAAFYIVETRAFQQFVGSGATLPSDAEDELERHSIELWRSFERGDYEDIYASASSILKEKYSVGEMRRLGDVAKANLKWNSDAKLSFIGVAKSNSLPGIGRGEFRQSSVLIETGGISFRGLALFVWEDHAWRTIDFSL